LWQVDLRYILANLVTSIYTVISRTLSLAEAQKAIRFAQQRGVMKVLLQP